jgi:hypothetical protein
MQIQLPNGFEVTAFLPDPHRCVFYLGSRQGALACYEIQSCKLIGVWRRIHDHEGVRSIQLTNNNSSNYAEILTAGRNSAYQFLRILFPEHLKGSLRDDVIDGSLPGVELQVTHRSNLNRGWLEGVFPIIIRANLVQNDFLQSFTMGLSFNEI